MLADVTFDAVPRGLASAVKSRGFTELTAIQEAVLDPAVAGKDLRLSSKTGSGKTVAIGFVMASQLGELAPSPAKRQATARPQALVVAPTRELAAQLGRELDWLYRPMQARLTVVTGGTSMVGDFHALSRCPHVVVGTPGRLVDHVNRGSLDLSAIEVVVLDEADEMLDMGFRDDLQLLLDHTPEDRFTHLVSATFPRDVLRLANRYQREPVMVEGSPVGKPNQDITHVGLTVHDRDKLSALINVLLAGNGQRTLVFARTRLGTASLANELCKNGFAAAGLHGDMSQRERTSTLEGFRNGATNILVATDVAARGLDIDDVAQVIHFDMPENDEVFTHRSGRTARAGKQGTCTVLVPPQWHRRAQGMFRRLGVKMDWQKVPSPKHVRRAANARLAAELTEAQPVGDSERLFAEKLLEDRDPVEVVAQLLERSNHLGPCKPRQVFDAKAPKARPGHDGPRSGKGPRSGGGPRRDGNFERFFVSWGGQNGANASRLLAMVCRRGNVRSNQIGAIRISAFNSVVEVSSDVAADFERAAKKPDMRNPKVRIKPWQDEQRGGKAPHRKGGKPGYQGDKAGPRKSFKKHSPARKSA
jgi:ATP-dependent RNA helicase DeaD